MEKPGVMWSQVGIGAWFSQVLLKSLYHFYDMALISKVCQQLCFSHWDEERAKGMLLHCVKEGS